MSLSCSQAADQTKPHYGPWHIASSQAVSCSRASCRRTSWRSYCAADVYVHCSDNEPHSLAITEAIYCGLPVVLSDRCGSYGPTDDVQPGINGFVYRCGDVSDLSRCIVTRSKNMSMHGWLRPRRVSAERIKRWLMVRVWPRRWRSCRPIGHDHHESWGRSSTPKILTRRPARSSLELTARS